MNVYLLHLCELIVSLSQRLAMSFDLGELGYVLIFLKIQA